MKYKDLDKDFGRRLKLSLREDGYVISTVKSLDNWYGLYETGVWLEGDGTVTILKGYDNKEDALEWHKKFCEMSEEDLNKWERIG